MDRRQFLTTSSAAGVATLAACGETAPKADDSKSPAAGYPRPIKMHVGTQRGGTTTAERLQYFKRHGVDHICGYPERPPEDRGYWTREDIEKLLDLCNKHKVSCDMVQLPFLSSSYIDREKRGAIMLGQSPERDRDIEHIQIMIKNFKEAGLPAMKYNMSLLGVLRLREPFYPENTRTPGRGGSSYSTWRLADAKGYPPLTRAGKVDEDEAWERITYFLERIIPVCNEYKLRAACHPHDPGVPPEGFQGIARVLGTVDGLKKFASIQESPYHGFNLCLGTTAEMLQDPKNDIHDVIDYLGSRKKIFNIHFRNIVGKRDDFYEVYPDNGDMNMVEVARSLWKVDYPYMLMPDHMPQHPDDKGGYQSYAFAYGYIKAILQSLETLG